MELKEALKKEQHQFQTGVGRNKQKKVLKGKDVSLNE